MKKLLLLVSIAILFNLFTFAAWADEDPNNVDLVRTRINGYNSTAGTATAGDSLMVGSWNANGGTITIDAHPIAEMGNAVILPGTSTTNVLLQNFNDAATANGYYGVSEILFDMYPMQADAAVEFQFGRFQLTGNLNNFAEKPVVLGADGNIKISSGNGSNVSATSYYYEKEKNYKFKVIIDAVAQRGTSYLVSGSVSNAVSGPFSVQENIELGSFTLNNLIAGINSLRFIGPVVGSGKSVYIDNVQLTGKAIIAVIPQVNAGEIAKGSTVLDVNINAFVNKNNFEQLIIKRNGNTMKLGDDYTIAYGAFVANATYIVKNPKITLTSQTQKGDNFEIDFGTATDTYGRTFRNQNINFACEIGEIIQDVEDDTADIENIVKSINSGVDLSLVTNDLVMPSVGPNGTIIEWIESSEPMYLTVEGVVTRPSYDDVNDDKIVTLTGTVSKNGIVRTIEITVTIKMYTLAEDLPTQDIRSIALVSTIDTSMTRLTLPTAGVNGTKFSWSTSNANTIDQYGVIHFSTSSQSVTLTVKAVRDDGSDLPTKPREFPFTVPAKSASNPFGGGGGSGGGGGVNGSINVIVPATTPEPEILLQNNNDANNNANLPFNDLEDFDWAVESISYFEKNQIITGKGDDRFAPNDIMIRADLVTILLRIAGGVGGMRSGVLFDDVPDGEYYSDAVYWAQSNGIVTGMDEIRFEPNSPITREQIAVILMRYIEYIGADYSMNATYRMFVDDEEISEYAKNAIQVLCQLGVIDGYEDNTVRPLNSATRAETAKLMHTALLKLDLIKD